MKKKTQVGAGNTVDLDPTSKLLVSKVGTFSKKKMREFYVYTAPHWLIVQLSGGGT
jgi:hypothetical protein